jgi:hypothetical protein
MSDVDFFNEAMKFDLAALVFCRRFSSLFYRQQADSCAQPGRASQ